MREEWHTRNSLSSEKMEESESAYKIGRSKIGYTGDST
jgi:hypothetical protein